MLSGLLFRDDGIRKENKQGFALFDGNAVDFVPWKRRSELKLSALGYEDSDEDGTDGARTDPVGRSEG